MLLGMGIAYVSGSPSPSGTSCAQLREGIERGRLILTGNQNFAGCMWVQKINCLGGSVD